MRTAVIGPGRLGTLLATACARSGHRVVSVAGGNMETRDRLVRLVAGVRPFEAPADAVQSAELVLLTVADDSIEELVRELVVADVVAEGQRLVHLSGSRGLGPLRRAALAGGRVAACHPALSVPSGTTDPEVLVGVPWAVTAAPVDLGWALDWVTGLGGDPHVVLDDRRALYHAGLTLGSNASAAAAVAARQLLLAAGIEDVPRFLSELATSSVRNAVAAGADAITGPVVRGDVGTIEAHLQAIEADLPELAGVYRAATAATLALAELPVVQQRRHPERLEALRRLLAPPRPEIGAAPSRSEVAAVPPPPEDPTAPSRPAPHPEPAPRPATVTTIAQLRPAVAEARRRGDRVALVPTMGALHQGHLELARLAAAHADLVVVSIFVNPTQFDRRDDLEAYPRDLEADLDRLASLGPDTPDLVFAPAVDEMYPRPQRTTVRIAGLGERLEGACRPGHFDGVATVVAKLFGIVQPDLAVFGRKDAQQGHVVRRLVADLDLPIEIVLAPTVREPDGLALSSRNRRLSHEQRRSALGLARALAAAVSAAGAARAAGRSPRAQEVRDAAAATLSGAEGLEVDYLEVVDPADFAPVGEEEHRARLLVLVAGRVGPVRLIDNVEVGDPSDEARLLETIGA